MMTAVSHSQYLKSEALTKFAESAKIDLPKLAIDFAKHGIVATSPSASIAIRHFFEGALLRDPVTLARVLHFAKEVHCD